MRVIGVKNLRFNMFEASCAALKTFSPGSIVRSRYPLAVAAGFLLAAAFPKIGIAGLAWVAPALMLAAGLGARRGESFRIGYAAGLAYYLLLLHWLLFIPVTGFPILGWIALSAFLALYPATWLWLTVRLTGIRAPGAEDCEVGANWLMSVADLSSWTWARRAFWALSGAAIWVALEMMLARLFGGFPWNLLGVSQYRILPLVQVASITGVSGLSFLVAWTSISLLCAAVVIVHRPRLRGVWLGEILLPFIALAAVFAFGMHQLKLAPLPTRHLTVTLVQPSIPQTLIWNPAKGNERFTELLRLSEQALTRPTDLLIWPEAAIPKLLRYDEETIRAITNLVITHRVWMIVGSDDAELSKHSRKPEDADYFNSSFLISPEGRLIETYRKRNLVMFGEYIPLVRWLPFIKWFTPIQGSFTPGDRAVPFEFTRWGERPREPQSTPEDGSPGVSPHQSVKTSVLICFEDTFPGLAREAAEPDTDFLVNLTNDGWFGESAAQWQHAVTALFRTVENGLPLVRCTNTGLTCWYDSTGRLREVLSDENGSIYGAGFMTVKIPLLPADERRSPTLYHQFGDCFGWLCVGLSAILLLQRTVGRKRTEEPRLSTGS
jgi:apolipoprotein N-acyltransferase